MLITRLVTVVGLCFLLLGGLIMLTARGGQVTRTLSLPASAGFQGVATSTASEAEPVPILLYHAIRSVDQGQDPAGHRRSVAPGPFADQLEALKHAGYTPITLTELLAGEYPERSLILSFDGGYADFFMNAYPALKRRDLTAVVFVPTELLDDSEGTYLTSVQVTELAAAGIEIGSQTRTQANLTAQTAEQLADELLTSRFELQQLTDQRIAAIAYPDGAFNDAVLAAARAAGYQLGLTTDLGVVSPATPHLTLPRIPVNGGESVEELLASIETARRLTAEPTE
ncbi:polysaccharide deacetylase family protein [Candidatus Berkelbacteria bacterium]|nr:polysaccharide deacetylase family protein [Candidatus Berkelbacteria bacterium]